MAQNDNVFEIGLAMAGAISAGAYSAGVIDFLFQALDAWELAKRQTPDAVPNHSICIRVAAGASAGSITAALAAVAAAGGLRRQKFSEPKKDMQEYSCVLPALYKAWVTMPDMASPGAAKPDLLSNNDLVDGVSPRSVLNAHILDALTDEALQLPPPPKSDDPSFGPAYGGAGLPYFAKRLHLYLTLSNMRGVPYRVGFGGAGAGGGHYMMSHGDRAHYILDGIGTHGGENKWLSQDTFELLKIATLPREDKERDPASYEQWQQYGRTALASAAFPLGLAARHIKSNVSAYKNRSWPGLPVTGSVFAPNWPSPWSPDDHPFGFMSVDGGLIDNEPFEYARRAIMLDGRDSNERDESRVTGAVLMVDPFPEPPAFSPSDVAEASLVDVARAMFPMLKNQVRFKPDALAAALDNTIYSRWMIAPSRPVAGSSGAKDERYGIATGLLGGFGGFLDIAFREHDYQLGRRNCQKFLMDVFSVAEGHSFVKKWPSGVKERFRKHDSHSGKYYCPVIPLVGDAKPEVPQPQWKRIDEARLAEIERRIKARAVYVVPRLLTRKTDHKIKGWALRRAWKWLGEKPLLRFAHASIEADLIRRDQIDTWSSYSAEARAVLAELKAPAFDYRTIEGIDRAIYLNAEEITAALAELTKTPNLLWSGPVKGRECWALQSRRSGWLERHSPFSGEPRIG